MRALPAARLVLCGVRAVVFDLDDTLVPSSAIYARAYRALDLAARADFWRARALVKGRLAGGSPAAHQRLLYFKAMAEQAARARGGRVSPAALLRLQHAYERAVAAGVRAAWRRLAHARWLGRLAAAMPLGVCTNETTRMQLLKWRALDEPAGWCTAFVTSEELGEEKPRPLPFVETARRLGVPVRDCLMVGDDLQRDVAPALALGMRAVWTTEHLSAAAARQQAEAAPALSRGVPRVASLQAIDLA